MRKIVFCSIKHNQERDGKSTAVHAKIIAANDVEIYSYKNLPKIEETDRLLLLFPSPDAKTLAEIPQSSFDKLLVLDGTWAQVSNMLKHTPAFSKMRKVTIEPQTTLFWRFQTQNETYLATIEAIYYLLKEYHEAYVREVEYDGRYDNMLWYYKYFYEMIQATYRMNQGKRMFTDRQRGGYIHYD